MYKTSSSKPSPEFLGAPVLLSPMMCVNQPQQPHTLLTAQVHQKEMVLALFPSFCQPIVPVFEIVLAFGEDIESPKAGSCGKPRP